MKVRTFPIALLSLVMLVTSCGSPSEGLDGEEPIVTEPTSATIDAMLASVRFDNKVFRLTPGEEAAFSLPCDVPEELDSGLVFDPAPLATWFNISETVVQIDGTWFASIENPPTRDRVSPLGETDVYYEIDLRGVAVAVAGEAPETILVRPERFEALQVFGHNRTIIIAVSGGDFRSTGLTAVIDPDGGVAFEWVCGAWYTEEFAAFRASHPEMEPDGPAALIARLFVDDSAEATAYHSWLEEPVPTAWEDRSPSDRVIDPEEVPPELLESLKGYRIELEVDPDWLEYGPASLCVFVPDLGWASCVDLDAETPSTVTLVDLALPGADLELWVLDRAAHIGAPIAKVGVISAEEWAR